MSEPVPPPGCVAIEFQPLGRRVAVTHGASLLAAAQAAGVDLVSICGGEGSCEGCLVRPVRGPVSPPTPSERDTLGHAAISAGFRMACQTLALGNVTVDVPPESLTAGQRLQIEGLETAVIPDPAVRLADVAPGRPAARLLGLAVDLGTTKLALYLVDLSSGKTLGSRGGMNPQIAYGEDVVSRIAFVNESMERQRELQGRTVAALSGMLAELCRDADASPDSVLDLVIVGNTVMHHMLAGLPVGGLGRSPFAPVVTSALTIPATEIGFTAAPGAVVYLPPNPAGYVGSDHVAVLLASEMLPAADTVLVIDVGTNTEISLASRGRLLSCSCASGPAFEGAHIHDGMRAAPGAIERVRIAGGEVRTYTIGGRPPIGICGSGILDAVAELVELGVVERRGLLRTGHPLVRRGDAGPEFVLVPAAATGHNRDLVVRVQDVNEIQLAKAAIRTGIEILLLEAGITETDVDRVVLAGAFGTYLSVSSAIRVGMFPKLSPARFHQVGNAAGAGARRMLVSAGERRAAEGLADRAECVELTAHRSFLALFARMLAF